MVVRGLQQLSMLACGGLVHANAAYLVVTSGSSSVTRPDSLPRSCKAACVSDQIPEL